jgi:phosphoadenosine phosphosulfate reductase
MQSTTIIEIKPWYQRPRPSVAPDAFDAKLKHTLDTLRNAAEQTPCVLAHSLSAEDMAIFHLIATNDFEIKAIALDTARLPASAHVLWGAAETQYDRTIHAVTPAAERLSMLAEMSADSELYNDKNVRELCCKIRKTEPLRRALVGKKSWVTGLRRAQSAGRAQVPHREFDTMFALEKFNPLADWSDEDLWFFIDTEKIPVSTLYEKGYASIGCDPCSRPIRAGEHPRAGRWWWEQQINLGSECGIHVAAPITERLMKDIA